MSKFCGNCGMQVDDNAQVCGYCGNPFSSAGKKGGAVPGLDKIKGSLNDDKVKKLLPIIGGAVAGVIVLVVALVLILGNTGKKGLVKDFAKDLKAENLEALVSEASDLYGNEDDKEDVVEEQMDDLIDLMDDKADGLKSIKVDKFKAKKISENKVNKLKDVVDDDKDCDIDSDSIKEVYEIDVSFKIKGEKTKTFKLKDYSDNAHFYAIKESGKWKYFLYPGDFFDEISKAYELIED